jgi:hypothetical protein
MQPKTPKLLEAIRDAAAFIGEAVNRLAQHDPDTARRISKQRQIKRCPYCSRKSRRCLAGLPRRGKP